MPSFILFIVYIRLITTIVRINEQRTFFGNLQEVLWSPTFILWTTCFKPSQTLRLIPWDTNVWKNSENSLTMAIEKFSDHFILMNMSVGCQSYVTNNGFRFNGFNGFKWKSPVCTPWSFGVGSSALFQVPCLYDYFLIIQWILLLWSSSAGVRRDAKAMCSIADQLISWWYRLWCYYTDWDDHPRCVTGIDRGARLRLRLLVTVKWPLTVQNWPLHICSQVVANFFCWWPAELCDYLVEAYSFFSYNFNRLP